MRRFLLTLLSALAATAAPAQVLINQAKPTNLEYLNRELALGKGQVTEAVRGSSFVLPHWAPGRILMLNGATKAADLKFDLADNRLLWRRPAGDSLELFTEQIREFSLGDSLGAAPLGGRYVFRRYLDARIRDYPLRTQFFEVCYDEAGPAGLLRQRTRTVLSGSASPSLTRRRSATWGEQSVYFLRLPGNVIEPVRLTDKAVLAALGPARAAALTAYVAQQGLRLSQEADVVRLLRYYNALPAGK